jgi:hypothetical protein
MRLRHFVIDAQKVTNVSGGMDNFKAESSLTGGVLDTTNKVKLDPLVLYQGALQTHTNSDDVQFYGLMLTGSLSLDNIYTGNILKMTGSLSSKVEMTGSTGDISFQIIMVAPGEYSG